MRYKQEIAIAGREISISAPTYFIADIAANHDGDLDRALELIHKTAEAGADAVKFQHFLAKDIVSDYGFKHMKASSHQASWSKSVYEVYEGAELNRTWNERLAKEAESAGVHFLTTPYDYAAVEEIDSLVPAYKIGSGDVTWTDFVAHIATKNKPVLLATGAADITDVMRAVDAILAANPALVLMQCNTNYTGSLENLHHVNLNVLKTYQTLYPGMVLGLSDHTPGHATVLGAIALGARVIEKHFTDDNNRVGPDHAFSMNPTTWRDMVDRSRELEAALGDGVKRVEGNERETVVVQQRCVRLKKAMSAGAVVTANDVECLRPAPVGALRPYELEQLVGKALTAPKDAGAALFPADFAD